VRYVEGMRGWFGQFRLERQSGRRPGCRLPGGRFAHRRDRRAQDAAARADPMGLTRLRREFAALRTLSHPNIVRVLDVGEEEGIPWLSMEFVEA